MAESRNSRIGLLANALERRGVGAFLCTSGVTMNYLVGMSEEGGERLLTLAVHKSGAVRMICPALTRNQAERAGIQDIRSWTDGEDPLKLVGELSSDWDCGGSAIAVDDETRAAILLDLQRTLPGVSFVAGQPVLSDLMRVKGADELGYLRQAGRAADEALAPTLAEFRAGMTEMDVNDALQRHMRACGGEPAFCIVATGSHGAEPHHHTGSTKLQIGDVVIMDFGCTVNGYKSDITRVAAVGSATDEQKRVYDVVYRAHMAGRAAIRPGVAAEDVDRATRAVIEKAGYGQYFVHRTGHGLGMRIHEEPYICAGNKFELEVGNVFSIEPGIYLPGRFGVRIENIVAVTENGHESLNAEPSPVLTVVPV